MNTCVLSGVYDPTFVGHAFSVEQWMGRLVSVAIGDRQVVAEKMAALSCEVRITASVPTLTWIVNVAATNIAAYVVAVAEDDVVMSSPVAGVVAPVAAMVETEIVDASWRVKALGIFDPNKVLVMKVEIIVPECSLHCKAVAEAVGIMDYSFDEGLA